jgi:hypothetical protein
VVCLGVIHLWVLPIAVILVAAFEHPLTSLVVWLLVAWWIGTRPGTSAARKILVWPWYLLVLPCVLIGVVGSLGDAKSSEKASRRAPAGNVDNFASQGPSGTRQK